MPNFMKDPRGEPVTVSRDLHVVSDQGQCIAAKVVAATADSADVVLFIPQEKLTIDGADSEAVRGVTLHAGSAKWHWPRDCRK